MSDTVYRQAAIDCLCNGKCTEEGRWCDDGDCMPVRRIKSLPSAQKWIPCSERLPDVAQRVLLSGHGQVMIGMLHSSGKYSLEPTGIAYVYPKDDIEAWMPLPELWRGEGEPE